MIPLRTFTYSNFALFTRRRSESWHIDRYEDASAMAYPHLDGLVEEAPLMM